MGMMMYWSMELKIKSKQHVDTVKKLIDLDADAQYYELYIDNNSLKVECDDCEATLDDEKWERICKQLAPYVDGEIYFKDELGSTFWKMRLFNGKYEYLAGEICYGDEIEEFINYNKEYLSDNTLNELKKLQVTREL